MTFNINEFAKWFEEKYGRKLTLADAKFAEMVLCNRKHVSAGKTRHTHKGQLLTACIEYYKEKRDGSGQVRTDQNSTH